MYIYNIVCAVIYLIKIKLLVHIHFLKYNLFNLKYIKFLFVCFSLRLRVRLKLLKQIVQSVFELHLT